MKVFTDSKGTIVSFRTEESKSPLTLHGIIRIISQDGSMIYIDADTVRYIHTQSRSGIITTIKIMRGLLRDANGQILLGLKDCKDLVEAIIYDKVFAQN